MWMRLKPPYWAKAPQEWSCRRHRVFWEGLILQGGVTTTLSWEGLSYYSSDRFSTESAEDALGRIQLPPEGYEYLDKYLNKWLDSFPRERTRRIYSLVEALARHLKYLQKEKDLNNYLSSLECLKWTISELRQFPIGISLDDRLQHVTWPWSSPVLTDAELRPFVSRKLKKILKDFPPTKEELARRWVEDA